MGGGRGWRKGGAGARRAGGRWPQSLRSGLSRTGREGVKELLRKESAGGKCYHLKGEPTLTGNGRAFCAGIRVRKWEVFISRQKPGRLRRP